MNFMVVSIWVCLYLRRLRPAQIDNRWKIIALSLNGPTAESAFSSLKLPVPGYYDRHGDRARSAPADGGGLCSFSTPRPYSTFAHPLLYEISHGCPQPAAAGLVYMEFAKLETAALAHVDDSYYYG